MRLLNFGSLIVFLVLAWQFSLRHLPDSKTTKIFAFASLAGLFGYLSLEVWTALNQFVPGLRMGGLSIFWAIFALSILLAGISKSQAELRGIGLTLFTAVILKVFVIDLAGLDQIFTLFPSSSSALSFFLGPFSTSNIATAFSLTLLILRRKINHLTPLTHESIHSTHSPPISQQLFKGR